MDPKIKEYFDKAREFAQRGENYEKQSNFELAEKCYANVAINLNNALKFTDKIESVQALKQKIQKYQAKVTQMIDKKKAMQVGLKPKTLISKFGFPEKPKNNLSYETVSLIKKQPMRKTAPNRKSLPDKNNEAINLISQGIKVGFDDIAGMKDVKQALYEAVIMPQKRPDLFEGIRSPPRGVLLYGPPGNGKTMITKALAKESGCTFYGVSAGSIVNKFVGESEKTLRSIFESAKSTAPSIIFIDEIDSMLTARSQQESDNTRRLKTQFLVQFDNLQGPVIVIGATNLPNELDLAALRRFNKLIYIGLPDRESRKVIIHSNLKQLPYSFTKTEENNLISKLEGYSASEITDIIKEASMAPIRELSAKMLETVEKKKIREIKYEDFVKVIDRKKPLLSKQDLKKYQGKFN